MAGVWKMNQKKTRIKIGILMRSKTIKEQALMSGSWPGSHDLLGINSLTEYQP